MSDRTTDISLILKDLLKVIKVVSMYPEDNPLPQSLKRSFSEKLENIVSDYGDIKINVEKNELLFENEPVFQDRSKEENLANIFFETGITNFTFKTGLDVAEIYTLLEVLKKYLNTKQNKEDLVAMIWEANIPNFKITTVEDIALAEYKIDVEQLSKIVSEGTAKTVSKYKTGKTPLNYSDIFNINIEKNAISLDDTPQPGDSEKIGHYVQGEPGHIGAYGSPVITGSSTSNASTNDGEYVVYGSGNATEMQQSFFAEVGIDENSFRINEASKAMGLNDIKSAPVPDTTIILNKEFELSKTEEMIISLLTKNDASFDPYESTLELLKEMLHQESDTPAFYETVTICEKIHNEFIINGKILEASILFGYLNKFGEHIRNKKPMWSERIKESGITFGSRERLKTFSLSLNNHPETGAGVFRQYLDNFDWEALMGLVSLLGELTNEDHRNALADYLSVRGKNKINIISTGLEDKNTDIVKNCMFILARIDDERTNRILSKLINNENREVRLTLADILKESIKKDSISILKHLATDRDPEVRKVAVNSICGRKGKEAFEAVAEIINDEKFEHIAFEDQQLLLNAFSILGGDIAVNYLLKLIQKVNLFGSHTDKFYRIAAFEALSKNKSEKAEKVLIKLSNSWRPQIKNLAQQTLHDRRTHIHGGNYE